MKKMAATLALILGLMNISSTASAWSFPLTTWQALAVFASTYPASYLQEQVEVKRKAYAEASAKGEIAEQTRVFWFSKMVCLSEGKTGAECAIPDGVDARQEYDNAEWDAMQYSMRAGEHYRSLRDYKFLLWGLEIIPVELAVLFVCTNAIL